MAAPLLELEDLSVTLPTPSGAVRAVNGVSLSVRTGERLGIVGESGAGKTMTALRAMGLVPSPPATLSGRVLYRGTDLATLPSRDRRRLCGATMAMTFQDPMTCLNPRMTVGDQIAEAIRAHERLSKVRARARAVELLGLVAIPAPARRADEYPHRLSGGMAQRVMMAMALSCGPDLIFADEPTTALDVTIEAEVIDLLVRLCEEQKAAVVLITHDLALLARFADRVAVMYAGRVVEEGDVSTIYQRPAHPYTVGLLRSVTRADQPREARLTTIEGAPPSALALPGGCPFHPRCPRARDICSHQEPELTARTPSGHRFACHFPSEPSHQPQRDLSHPR
ncbi:MAG: ABC transporter ATP-binding protein [Acidimicrobiales bacterium]